MSHVLTRENIPEALEAIRDILAMYVDVAENGLFVHNADIPIRFDPLRFVDVVQDSAKSYYVDVDLLRTGSALAMFAIFATQWSEERGVHAGNDTERFLSAVRGGRLRHLPDIEEVLLEFLAGQHASMDDPWVDNSGVRLCEVHVRGYFRRLANGIEGRGPDSWTTLKQ